MDKTFRSPLFYVGDKYKLIPELKHYFPSKIQRFIEPFTGGGSVFLNVQAKQYFLNDIDPYVCRLHQFLIEQASSPNAFFSHIQSTINKYNLSHSYRKDVIPLSLKQQWKKTYYAKYNKKGYERLRDDFNDKDPDNLLYLYLLLIFGFNRMLRFNAKGEFNIPVGNVDFNANVQKALNDYFCLVPSYNIQWYNQDYSHWLKNLTFQKDDFVYLDPPYLITFSEYNKWWSEQRERKLLTLLDELNKKNVKFAISNVTYYKGKENQLFIGWAEKYNVFDIKSNYISYHDNSIKKFNEVLVTNYE